MSAGGTTVVVRPKSARAALQQAPWQAAASERSKSARPSSAATRASAVGGSFCAAAALNESS